MDMILAVNNPSGSSGSFEAIGFFIMQWAIVLIGATIHFAVDRGRHGHRAGRGVELYLLWLLVFGGAWAIYGGVGHISGMSDQLAETIGYAPSMFQWEVGWGDIAVGVLGFGCAWVVNRGKWMTAAVVAITLAYGGDAIGHVMQWMQHSNDAPDNVWAIPSDIAQPLLAIVLLLAYRRGRGRLAHHGSPLAVDAEEPPAAAEKAPPVPV